MTESNGTTPWKSKIVGHDRVAPETLVAKGIVMNEAATEQWLSVPGYEGLYSVSDRGRVRTDCRRRKWGGRVTLGYPNQDGYMRTSLTIDGQRKKRFVHQIVAAAFIGDADGREVNHRDGDKTNNTPANLEYVTHRENMRHAIATGLWNPSTGIGESSPISKLTDEAVRDIRKRCAAGESRLAIANSLSVSRHLVGAVDRGEVWGHVE